MHPDGSQLTVMPAGAAKLVTANLMVSDAADSLSAVVNVTVVAGAPASLKLYELVQGTVQDSSADAVAPALDASVIPTAVSDAAGA
jgi:formaldehyde-activating enzyme involved in methanogenesis